MLDSGVDAARQPLDLGHTCPSSDAAKELISSGSLNGQVGWRIAMKRKSGYIDLVEINFCPWCGEQLQEPAQQRHRRGECGRSFGADGMPLASSVCLRNLGHDGTCYPVGVMPGTSENFYKEVAERLDAAALTARD